RGLSEATVGFAADSTGLGGAAVSAVPPSAPAATAGVGAVGAADSTGFGGGSGVLVAAAGSAGGAGLGASAGALATAPLVTFRVVNRNTATAPPMTATDKSAIATPLALGRPALAMSTTW